MGNNISGDGSKIIRILDDEYSVAGSPKDAYYLSLVSPHRDEVIRVQANIISPDDVVFDIGANIGIITLPLSRMCSKGHVYSFEPGRMAFGYLNQNIVANNIHNVETFNVAIGRVDGAMEFFESAEFGAGSFSLSDELVEYTDAYKLRPSTIPVLSVDSFVRERDIRRLDFIKIDIEGDELSALSGAEATLDKFKPRVVLEINSANLILHQNKSPLAVIRTIMGIFDEVYSIDRGSGRLYPIQSSEDVLVFAQHNLLNGFVDNLLCAFKERSLSELSKLELTRFQYGLEWPDEGLSHRRQVSFKDYEWLKERYVALEKDRDYWRGRVE